jgi:hypothetical protein
VVRTLRSTNAIESMISICRSHSANVKRWRDGRMALRWCAAGMIEAGKHPRRVDGHLHLPRLRAALDAEITATVAPVVQEEVVAARRTPGRHRRSTELRTTSRPSARPLRQDLGGTAAGDDEYVLCADEKTQLQALRRCHPDLPAAPGRIRRSEFEYRRDGTLAHLAA